MWNYIFVWPQSAAWLSTQMRCTCPRPDETCRHGHAAGRHQATCFWPTAQTGSLLRVRTRCVMSVMKEESVRKGRKWPEPPAGTASERHSFTTIRPTFGLFFGLNATLRVGEKHRERESPEGGCNRITRPAGGWGGKKAKAAGKDFYIDPRLCIWRWPSDLILSRMRITWSSPDRLQPISWLLTSQTIGRLSSRLVKLIRSDAAPHQTSISSSTLFPPLCSLAALKSPAGDFSKKNVWERKKRVFSCSDDFYFCKLKKKSWPSIVIDW